MPAVINPIVILISTALSLLAGATSSEIILPVAVTVHLTCTADDYSFPLWILEGQVINAIPSDERERLGVDLLTADIVGSSISSPIRINGSSAIHGWTLQCRIREEIVYNTTLLYQESLPAPSNLTAVNVSGSFMIEWEPLILQDTELDHVRIHMNPNILVYSVNIMDTTNGTTWAVNVTQTSYRFTDFIQCHRYQFQVSAWNAAGEGDRNIQYSSERVPATLRNDQVRAMVPVQAIYTRKRQQQGTITISFNVQMDISCQAKLPDAIDVTVTGPGLVTNRQIPYDHSEEVNFTITVTGVEDCTHLRVHIRARNSAGTSQFSEIPVECQYTDHSTPTTPTRSTASSDTPSTDLVDQNQQGDNTMIHIAIGIAVGAVVIVAAVALLLIILWKCRRNTKVEKDEVVMNHNQAYETVTRMNHSRPATKVPTEPCPAYGVVGAYHT